MRITENNLRQIVRDMMLESWKRSIIHEDVASAVGTLQQVSKAVDKSVAADTRTGTSVIGAKKAGRKAAGVTSGTEAEVLKRTEKALGKFIEKELLGIKKSPAVKRFGKPIFAAVDIGKALSYIVMGEPMRALKGVRDASAGIIEGELMAALGGSLQAQMTGEFSGELLAALKAEGKTFTHVTSAELMGWVGAILMVPMVTAYSFSKSYDPLWKINNMHDMKKKSYDYKGVDMPTHYPYPGTGNAQFSKSKILDNPMNALLSHTMSNGLNLVMKLYDEGKLSEHSRNYFAAKYYAAKFTLRTYKRSVKWLNDLDFREVQESGDSNAQKIWNETDQLYRLMYYVLWDKEKSQKRKGAYATITDARWDRMKALIDELIVQIEKVGGTAKDLQVARKRLDKKFIDDNWKGASGTDGHKGLAGYLKNVITTKGQSQKIPASMILRYLNAKLPLQKAG